MEAIQKSKADLGERQKENGFMHHILLNSPDEMLKGFYVEEKFEERGITYEEFYKYIEQERDTNPDALGSADDELYNQMHMISTGVPTISRY